MHNVKTFAAFKCLNGLCVTRAAMNKQNIQFFSLSKMEIPS